LTRTTHSAPAAASAGQRDRPPAALNLLAPLLECPRCRHAGETLAARADHFVCRICKTAFPIVRSGAARIPWLFRDPEAARLEWSSRYSGFLHASSAEKARLELALGETRRRKSAAARIEAQLQARDAQRKSVMDLLGPLALGVPRGSRLDRPGVLYPTPKKRDSPANLSDAIFRDWSWESGENDSLAECLRSVSRERRAFAPARMLTLGAGACRLAYDLHRGYTPRLSVAIDPNPLLLMVAARVIHGETVSLPEFPRAPLDKASFAVMRTCAAPMPLVDGRFALALGDPLNAPFKPGGFDVVCTSGIMHAAPQDLGDLVRSVNRLLENGGTWLNTGPIAFTHRNESWRYSDEEIVDLVAASGFDVVETDRRAVPWFQSPASSVGCIVHVLSFCAVKSGEAAAGERARDRPWLLDTRLAVPDLDELVVAGAQRLVQAQILGAVDGRRSIAEIAQLVAKRYGLHASEAEGAVRRVLADCCNASDTDGADPLSSLA
jgi:SAM-dependent methyltransferase